MISDDSGLCIKALSQKPGIYSARLAKKHGSFFKAMKFILKKMKNKKIDLQLSCVVYLLNFQKKKVINVTGRLKGIISKKILGDKGFGYDPIFIPNNLKKTFGEMSKRKKLKIDHRYLAFKKLKKKIKIL